MKGRLIVAAALVFAIVAGLVIIPDLATSRKVYATSTILSVLRGQEVWLSTDGGATWAPAQQDSALEPGWGVRTGSDSRALITFFEGSTVEIEPNSEVLIQALQGSGDTTSITLYQKAGRTWNRVEKLISLSSRYEVITSSAVGAVRGTLVDIEVDPSSRTIFKAYEGSVRVNAGRGEELVEAGMQSTVEPGGPPSPSNAIPAPPSRLEFASEGIAYMRVVDPAGRSAGLAPPGTVINQVPQATSSGGPGRSQEVIVPELASGEYIVILEGEAGAEAALTIRGFVEASHVFEGRLAGFEGDGRAMQARLSVTLDQDGYLAGALLHDIEPLTGDGAGKVISQPKPAAKAGEARPPKANFSSHTAPGELEVSFNDISTGEIDGRTWDFGDGQASTEASPIHVYAAAGSYQVTLNITGPGGADSRSRQVIVPEEPSAILHAGFTVYVNPQDRSAAFSNLSTGRIDSYSWDFGDGQGSDAASPSHTYALPGVYQVTLVATGPDGSDARSRPVDIPGPGSAAPRAGFRARTSPQSNEVRFSDLSTGEITDHLWDFGDGQDSREASPIHTYDAPGIYSVTLTVSGPGGSDSFARKVRLTAGQTGPPAPTAGFGVDVFGAIAAFTDLSTGPIATYAWDFGDGQGSSEASPVHSYPAPGRYAVTLTVTGPGGADSTGRRVEISAPPGTAPSADFGSYTSGHAYTVYFKDLSLGEITAHAWDFGDGQAGAEAEPVHTYGGPGKYTVVLTVSGPGGSSSKTKQIFLAASMIPPVLKADFSYQSDETYRVSFIDLSTGLVESYAWDFGDGQTSDEPNPLHVYAGPGDYTVILTVSGPGGTDGRTRVVRLGARNAPRDDERPGEDKEGDEEEEEDDDRSGDDKEEDQGGGKEGGDRTGRVDEEDNRGDGAQGRRDGRDDEDARTTERGRDEQRREERDRRVEQGESTDDGRRRANPPTGVPVGYVITDPMHQDGNPGDARGAS